MPSDPPIRLFYYQATAGGRPPPRPIRANQHEAEVILSGSGEFHLDGRWQTVQRGDLVCWQPGETIQVRQPRREPYACIVLQFHDLGPQWPGLPALYRWLEPLAALDFAQELFDRYHAVIEPPPDWRRDAVYGRLLLEAERARLDGEAADWPAGLRRAVRHAASHHADAIGVPDLARAGGLSESHLHRLFRRHLGCAPGEYLCEKRLSRARHLLSTTTAPVKRVAAQAGFGDPVHFHRLFRARCGMTPGAYRRRHQPPPDWRLPATD